MRKEKEIDMTEKMQENWRCQGKNEEEVGEEKRCRTQEGEEAGKERWAAERAIPKVRESQ